MSACSRTVRAASRSRVPPLKTLLPFLYQTSTIQQCHSAIRPIARRSIASRSRLRDGDHIPFVDDDLPPPIDQGPARKTTITSTERAAFEKLYKKFNTEGRQQKEKDHVVELDQIADEYYEDDEENSKPSMDELFDGVLKGESRLRPMRTLAQQSKTGSQSTKEATSGADSSKVRGGRRKAVGLDTTQLREIRLAERRRIDKLLRNATTDRDLWQILEREVFTKVRELDLDNVSTGESKAPATELRSGMSTQNAPRAKSFGKPVAPSDDQHILFRIYPHHLITAVTILRSEFPSSQLPLSILPMIKSLGRSSHALGATTTLYKHLIHTAWVQQCSYTTIDTLLTEMDNNAIEFDTDVLALLDAIIKEQSQVKSGVLGRQIRMVYDMEMFADAFGKISTWRDVVAERLGFKSEKIRMSNRLIRIVPSSGGARSSPLAPGNTADAQKQRDPFGREVDRPVVNEGSRGGNIHAEGAGSASPGVNRASEANPFAEGDSAGEIGGQEKNSMVVERPIEQKQDAEKPDALSELPKIMS